jgi:hypothetical protein
VDSHFKRHFPSPEENADNGSYVNYINLHAQNIPIPKPSPRCDLPTTGEIVDVSAWARARTPPSQAPARADSCPYWRRPAHIRNRPMSRSCPKPHRRPGRRRLADRLPVWSTKRRACPRHPLRPSQTRRQRSPRQQRLMHLAARPEKRLWHRRQGRHEARWRRGLKATRHPAEFPGRRHQRSRAKQRLGLAQDRRMWPWRFLCRSRWE